MFIVKFDNRDKTIEERNLEVLSKIDDYRNAQKFQLENGGPGPVAEIEIMTIVNQYNGEFEVLLPDPIEAV